MANYGANIAEYQFYKCQITDIRGNFDVNPNAWGNSASCDSNSCYTGASCGSSNSATRFQSSDFPFPQAGYLTNFGHRLNLNIAWSVAIRMQLNSDNNGGDNFIFQIDHQNDSDKVKFFPYNLMIGADSGSGSTNTIKIEARLQNGDWEGLYVSVSTTTGSCDFVVITCNGSGLVEVFHENTKKGSKQFSQGGAMYALPHQETVFNNFYYQRVSWVGIYDRVLLVNEMDTIKQKLENCDEDIHIPKDPSNDPTYTPNPLLIPPKPPLPCEKLASRELLHLFEFTTGDATKTIHRFTDNDVFVTVGGHEYIPLEVKFDTIKQNFMLEANSVNTTLSNIDTDFFTALQNEGWRYNEGIIWRVVYDEPPQITVGIATGLFPQNDLYPSGTLYPTNGSSTTNNLYPNDSLHPNDTLYPTNGSTQMTLGGFVFDDGYPSINFDTNGVNYDRTLLFRGIMDNLRGNEKNITLTITDVLSAWNRPYPAQRFQTGDYASIIDCTLKEVEWKMHT